MPGLQRLWGIHKDSTLSSHQKEAKRGPHTGFNRQRSLNMTHIQGKREVKIVEVENTGIQ